MDDNKAKFTGSETAVSEAIGYSLILGIVIVAVGVLVVIAYPIQSKIQDTAFIESQIQAITVLDGRISSVAFGVSPMQDTRINLNGGSMKVKNDSGNFMIINVSDQSGSIETIYRKELGTVEYTLNDNRIIYENGGLFRIYPNGESVMLSPPELYYNGETLTIPIIRVENAEMSGGKGMLVISSTQGNPPITIFPNHSTGYFRNPVYGKNITMKLKTDNYKAWKRYIDERTETSAGTNDITKEIFVKFNVEPSDSPEIIKDPVDVYGLDVTNGTPVRKFYLNLTGVNSSNLQMVFRAPSNTSDVFSLVIQKRDGCGTEGLAVQISYNNNGASESWDSGVKCKIFSGNADVDLLDQDIYMTYNNHIDSVTWANEAYPNNKTFSNHVGRDGPVDLYTVIQHYMKLISPYGTFSLYKSDKNNEWAGADFSASKLALNYKVMPPTIQFMHIIEHSVNVSIS